jgi:hypothetical protein
MMRALIIIGALLIAGGVFVLVKAPSYSSEKSVLKVAGLEAKVTEEHEIPGWAGAAGIAAGLAVIVLGARKP